LETEKLVLDTLLVVFVGLACLAFVLQSIAMWRAFGAVRETSKRLNAQSESIQKDIQEISARLKATADSLQPLGKMAEEVGATFQEISSIVKSRAGDLDLFVQEMVQIGRDQASKVDYVVTDTVKKFEETTDVIKRDILRPAIEISAFFKGIRSGLEFLFARKPAPRRGDFDDY
jgi:uncharacterized protein YoxC